MSSQPGWGARALGSVIIYQRSSLRYARSYRHTLKSHPALRFCIDFSSRQAAPCSRAHIGRRVDHELGGVAHERPRALHGARTRSPRTITPGSRRNFTPHRDGCCEWSLEWPEGRSGGMLGRVPPCARVHVLALGARSTAGPCAMLRRARIDCDRVRSRLSGGFCSFTRR